MANPRAIIKEVVLYLVCVYGYKSSSKFPSLHDKQRTRSSLGSGLLRYMDITAKTLAVHACRKFVEQVRRDANRRMPPTPVICPDALSKFGMRKAMQVGFLYYNGLRSGVQALDVRPTVAGAKATASGAR